MFELEGFLAFLIIGTGLLGEIILAALWVPVYFQRGIPIYSHTWQFQQIEQFTAKLPALNQIVRHFNKYPAVKFNRLGENEVAFAEQQDAAMLHGIIRVDPILGKVEVTGYLNWVWPFVFLAFALFQDITEFLIPFAIFVFVIFMQRRACERISQLIHLSISAPSQFNVLLEKGSVLPSPTVQKWTYRVAVGIGIIGAVLVLGSLVSWLKTVLSG